MSSTVPAGWYPDPLGSSPLRWWDGQTWTTATSAEAPGQATAPASDGLQGASRQGIAQLVAVQPQSAARSVHRAASEPAQSPYAAPYGASSYGQPHNGAQQPWGGVGYPVGYQGTYQQGTYQQGNGRPGQPARGNANKYAFITLGVVAAYVVVALTIGVVFFGIIPIVMAARSVRAREPLAPLAIVAAVLAIGMAIVLVTGG